MQNEHQRELIRHLTDKGKQSIRIWHRRSGKSDACLQCAAIAEHERKENVYLVDKSLEHKNDRG